MQAPQLVMQTPQPLVIELECGAGPSGIAKRKPKKVYDDEINALSKIIATEADEAEHFGMLPMPGSAQKGCVYKCMPMCLRQQQSMCSCKTDFFFITVSLYMQKYNCWWNFY